MKTREELRKQLIENRLMQDYEETELFEEAMNKLYEENNLENIKYYCEAFDDSTGHYEVMFEMIHGIENYDQVFTPEKATEKLINSVQYFNSNSKEWQEVLFLRIINNPTSRELLKNLLIICYDKESKKFIIGILKRIIERNRAKFEENVNYVLTRIS